MGRKQAFDGRRVTMGLMGPLDLYRKLRWESKMVDQLAITDGGGAIYCALNAAISAWQLGDWMAVALAHDQRWPLAATHLAAKQMQTKQDLQVEMRKCDALVACQQIAAAGKHLHIEQVRFVTDLALITTWTTIGSNPRPKMAKVWRCERLR
jgi:hypothetical protein